MRALTAKAMRDLWHLRGPVAAITVVTLCGVAAFVSMRSMVHHLTDSQAGYYARARFGDLFVRVKRAPVAEIGRIAALPGVDAADGWVAGDVVLDVPGLSEPASGRIVGLLSDSPRRVNRVTITVGRAPHEGSGAEVVLSEGFAGANQLVPGDSLGAVVNGTWRRLLVVGIGLSPEYVYEVRPGDIFPDNRRFGVIWMDRHVVEADFGMTGEWNQLAVRLAPGASLPAVRDAIDARLARYGTFGAFDRDLHVSHRYVSEEIGQNRTSAAVIPVIFLGVAAFLLSFVLARIVASQREQIGMLKAFGCPTGALVRHYALIALVPVAVAVLFGSALGLWAAYRVADLYREFFRFPGTHFVPHAAVFVAAVAAAGAAAAAGAYAAVRRVVALTPAEAMRPEPPVSYARGLADWLRLDRAFGPVGLMTARALLRRPARTGLSVLGLALGASVMIVGTFTFDAVRRMRDVQFLHADREDVAVGFDRPRGKAVLRELARLPGVTRVEAERSLAVRVRHGRRQRQIALVGVDENARLRRAVDLRGRPAPFPHGGATISTALARLLDARAGDTITVELLEGRRTTHAIVVDALVNDLIGTSAYVEAPVIGRLAGSSDVITGAVLAADVAMLDTIFARLKRSPGVSSVAVRAALMENFDALVERSFAVTLGILVAFASAITIGVVYNGARLALSERARELASLRVLGFSRAEVGRMLLGEQAVLTLASLPVGAAIGALLSWGVVRAMGSTELWRMPFVISLRTFAAAALLVAVSSVASGLLVRRRLDRVDLVQVLKARE